MERKKIIWILISVCIVLVVCFIAGILFLDPAGKNPRAPASLFSRPSPRASAADYVSGPSPSPSPLAVADNGDIIVAFGQDSSTPVPLASPVSGDGSLVVDLLPSPRGVSQGGNVPSAAPAASPAQASPRPSAKPQPKASPAPKASAKPPVKTKIVTEYWIQTASFTSRGKADDHKAALGEMGLGAVITTKDVSGVTYYRVRIGPYSTMAEAKGWLERVKSLPGCADAYISENKAERSS